jgi:short-subunit dehydrogenase
MSSIEGAGGQHIIITGASSGLGEAMARLLARHGHRLVLAARRVERLEALRDEINPSGKRVIVAQTDVARPEDLELLVERARNVFGPLDVVINNAGITGDSGRWWQRSPEQALQVIDVNLSAAMRLTHLALPDMLRHRRGHIINIGSVSGRIATGALYSASKFGLRGFSLGLRRELAGTGVEVSLVAPGFIATDMTANMQKRSTLPIPGPEVIANAVLYLLEHPRAELVVPGWYRPLIWLENTFPSFGDWVLKQMAGDG